MLIDIFSIISNFFEWDLISGNDKKMLTIVIALLDEPNL